MQNFITMVMNSLKSMSFTAIIDILVVAFIFYKGYMLIKETRAEQLLKGIAFIIILIPISAILNLSMLYFILSKTLTIGIISVVIIFQPEIRRALEHLGRSAFEDKHGFVDKEQRNIYVNEIVNAVSNLADSKTGALIAIEQGTGLGEIISSGTIIEAKITSNLLENIFVVNTPLHDGATIIGKDKILAAGCVLPLTNNKEINKKLGTRHRAGIGLSEISDALVIIVSEETGIISLAINGRLTRNYDKDRLRSILLKIMDHREEKNVKTAGKQKVIVQLVCILLSLCLWIYVTNIKNPIKSYELKNVPVEILNSNSLQDSGLALVPNQNFYVNLKIEGNTQDLFNVDKDSFKIIVDLSEYVLKKGENKVAVNIKESPSSITIKNSNGLTISVNTEEYATNEVPVKSEINITSKSSYYVATPVFSPKTVVVSGPKSLVKKVTKVVAQGEESNASKTIVKDFIISPVDENDNEVIGVKLSEKWVEGTIEINEGKVVPIKINTTGTLKDGLTLKSISGDIAEVGITGPEDVLRNISEIGTEEINLSEIKDSTNIEVALGIPDKISIYNGKSSINVNISIDKAKTKDFTIAYSIVGAADGLTITPDSNKVTITVSANSDVLDSLTEENFNAQLDVSQYTEAGEYNKAPEVTIVNADNITINNVSEVKLTVTKNSEDNNNGSIETDKENNADGKEQAKE